MIDLGYSLIIWFLVKIVLSAIIVSAVVASTIYVLIRKRPKKSLLLLLILFCSVTVFAQTPVKKAVCITGQTRTIDDKNDLNKTVIIVCGNDRQEHTFTDADTLTEFLAKNSCNYTDPPGLYNEIYAWGDFPESRIWTCGADLKWFENTVKEQKIKDQHAAAEKEIQRREFLREGLVSRVLTEDEMTEVLKDGYLLFNPNTDDRIRYEWTWGIRSTENGFQEGYPSQYFRQAEDAVQQQAKMDYLDSLYMQAKLRALKNGVDCCCRTTNPKN